MRMVGGVLAVLAVSCGSTPAPAPAPAPAAAPPPASAASVVLGATDVTLVWPLPADDAQQGSMLAATSVGKYGELLPAALYEVPQLDERDFATTEDRTRLRVVAARFEPCRGSFGAPDDATCVNQMRLVMQVLRPGGGGTDAQRIGANDGAVLAFYKLTREELLTFARQTAALRDRHGGRATDVVGVHPMLAREGLGSAYAKELQQKILDVVGAQRLTRVTFFIRTAAREPQWAFGGFDIFDGRLVKKRIATLVVHRQTLEGAGPLKVVTPQTTAADNPSALLTLFGPPRPPSAAERAAFVALLRIQNPKKHTPESISCVECHASQRMQASAEKLLGLHATDFPDDAFVSSVRPADDKIDAENFHALGYLGANLAVSTRVANDTSAVLAEMTALLH